MHTMEQSFVVIIIHLENKVPVQTSELRPDTSLRQDYITDTLGCMGHDLGVKLIDFCQGRGTV